MNTTTTQRITPELLAALILGGGPGADTMNQRNSLSFGDFDTAGPEVKDPGDHPLSQNEEVLGLIEGTETLTPAGFNLAVANLQQEYGLELEPAKDVALYLQQAQVYSAIGPDFRAAGRTSRIIGNETTEYRRFQELLMNSGDFHKEKKGYFTALDVSDASGAQYDYEQRAGIFAAGC